MNVLEGVIERREGDAERRVRPADEQILLWLNRGVAPEVRLLSFDAWARNQLRTKLDWSWAGSARDRRIEQCRMHLEGIVLELWRRGWMLDGRRLANRIEALLGAVATYQKAGRVQTFWPYFKACVDRYVGLNAEELQAEAMQVGSTVQQLLGPLGIKRPAGPATLPELVASRADEIARAKGETLRAKQARERARQAACKADAQQPHLFV